MICLLLWVALNTAHRAGAQGMGPNIVENGNFFSLAGWSLGGVIWNPSKGGVNGGPSIAFQKYASQSIATEPGQTYLLDFWTQSSTPLIQVNWGTENLGIFPAQSGLQGWTVNQLYVTAQSTSTLLDFSCSNPTAECYLDDVGVYSAAVPESSTDVLCAAGAVLLWTFGYVPRSRRNLGRN